MKGWLDNSSLEPKLYEISYCIWMGREGGGRAYQLDNEITLVPISPSGLKAYKMVP